MRQERDDLAVFRQREPVLEPGDIERLCVVAQTSEGAEKQRAMDTVVRASIRLAVRLAHRYRNSGLPFQDLMQEGFQAIIEDAIPKFEFGRAEFLAFAYSCINTRLQRAASSIGTRAGMFVPEYVIGDLKFLNKLRRHHASIHGRLPDIDRLMMILDGMPMSEERRQHFRREHVVHVLQCERLLRVQSLQTPLGEAETSELGDLVADESLRPQAGLDPPEVVLEIVRARRRVLALLDQLPWNRQDILRRRYGLCGFGEETLEQIGSDYGCSKERIRQLERSGLAALARRLGWSVEQAEAVLQELGELDREQERKPKREQAMLDPLELLALFHEHAVEAKGGRYVLHPAKTLMVRLGLSPGAAQSVIDHAVRHKLLAQVPGVPAVRILNGFDAGQKTQKDKAT